MAMAQRKGKVGQVFVNKEGYEFYIKEYYNSTYVIVKFMDEHGAEVTTQYQYCKSGSIHNPFHETSPCYYGIGCLGEGVKTTDGYTRQYRIWKGMLERCYSGRYKSYENVTVCERWHCFANFLEDLPLIEGYELWLKNEKQYALDKDIKQQDVQNKVYSLETCMFITVGENVQEMHERKRKEKIVLLNESTNS